MNRTKSATSNIKDIKEWLRRNHKVMTPTEKVLLWICDFFGFTTAVLAWITNLSNINSAILAIIGISWGSVRLYFYIRKNKIAVKRAELEQQIREWEWRQKVIKHDKENL